MKQSFMLLFQGRLQFEAFNSCRYIQSPYELLGAKRPTDFFVLMFVQLLYQFGRTCVLWHRMFKSNKFVGLTTAISLFIHHTPPFISPNFNFNQTLITKLYESKISKLYNHEVGLILNQAQLTASIQYKISLIRYPENRKD